MQQRHQQFAVDLAHLDRSAGRAQHAVAEDIAGPVGQRQLRIRLERVGIGAIVGAQREPQVPRRQLCQAALDVPLDGLLAQFVGVERAARDIADAVLRGRDVAERVEAAGAQFGAAGRTVEQPRDRAGAGAAALRILELGLAGVGVEVPRPVAYADLARQPGGELVHVILVGLDARSQDAERLVEGDGRIGARPRRQDRAERRGDERVRRRHGEAIDVRGQRRVRHADRTIGGVAELAERLDVVGDVVVDLAEHRIAIEIGL